MIEMDQDFQDGQALYQTERLTEDLRQIRKEMIEQEQVVDNFAFEKQSSKECSSDLDKQETKPEWVADQAEKINLILDLIQSQAQNQGNHTRIKSQIQNQAEFTKGDIFAQVDKSGKERKKSFLMEQQLRPNDA